jgi:hypothetical protein
VERQSVACGELRTNEPSMPIISRVRQGTGDGENRFVCMTPVNEKEVAYTAHFMGYQLLRGDDGYALLREYRSEQKLIEASSLEAIADFLKH